MVSIGDKNFMVLVTVSAPVGNSAETLKPKPTTKVSYVKPWIDDKGNHHAGFTFYNMTNEYVDYNRDGDEIARYYKKRIGEELFFSRVTDNEFITNSVT